MDIRPIDANALCEGRVCNDPVRIAAMFADTLSLNTLRDAIYQDAVAHGLWEEADAAKDVLQLHDCCVDIIAAEVCEMGEAWDNKDAFEEELADTVIASFSVAGKLGIDIDAAIRRKMAINKQRPWKHGRP